MRSTVDGHLAGGGTGSSNNNNSNNENSGNSGSQYALCALGVGLVALGIVMIVWSVVPADAAGNNSSNSGGHGDTSSRKNKASSIAFVLVGSGVFMLLLSLCLGLRNKQREQLRLAQARNHGRQAAGRQEDRETAEEQAQHYAVPSYEEAVGSGQYPVRQSNLRPSTSQLPSYDDLVQVDGVQYESEVPEVTSPGSQPAPSAASTSNRRPGKNNRKLLPIKIRRIKSEKLHMKNIDNSQPAAGYSIEPLTPPPQYEDKVPPI
ncbi:transmembrane protein 51 [Labrus bergylta]|uniref:transmembrane protein 51 n=1 Tax=Labrus bergylta TaxID=56723 RepID=UPI0009B33106|nr:transmembrane protein 51-like [Labrus bergylta]